MVKTEKIKKLKRDNADWLTTAMASVVVFVPEIFEMVGHYYRFHWA